LRSISDSRVKFEPDMQGVTIPSHVRSQILKLT
jgi:hypothetical protein